MGKEKLRHILVTGQSGSGKSTEADRLGKELNVPVIHLDDQPGFGAPGVDPNYIEDLDTATQEIINNLDTPHIVEGTQMTGDYFPVELLKQHDLRIMDADEDELVRRLTTRGWNTQSGREYMGAETSDAVRQKIREDKKNIDRLRSRLSKTSAEQEDHYVYHVANKISPEYIENMGELVPEEIKTAQENLSVLTAVPKQNFDLIMRKGLASQKAISEDPELTAAYLKQRGVGEAEWREELAAALKGWHPESRIGPSVFFTPPDPDKVSDPRHFINQFDTTVLRVNLDKLMRDVPGTRVFGSELEPYSEGASKADPENYYKRRRRDLTRDEILAYTNTDPKELWKHYSEEDIGKYYASNVPHGKIITPSGIIPPEYLEQVEKTAPEKLKSAVLKTASTDYLHKVAPQFQGYISQKRTKITIPIKDLPQTPPPSDNSQEVGRELLQIKMHMEEAKLPESLMVLANDDPASIFFLACKKFNIASLEKQALEIKEDFNKIAFDLKYKFKRLRPWSLAPSHGITLNVDIPDSADTPSYPSGHAMMGYGLAEFYKSHYPEYSNQWDKIADIIQHSRLQAGVHFPSDIKYAKKLVISISEREKIAAQGSGYNPYAVAGGLAATAAAGYGGYKAYKNTQQPESSGWAPWLAGAGLTAGAMYLGRGKLKGLGQAIKGKGAGGASKQADDYAQLENHLTSRVGYTPEEAARYVADKKNSLSTYSQKFTYDAAKADASAARWAKEQEQFHVNLQKKVKEYESHYAANNIKERGYDVDALEKLYTERGRFLGIPSFEVGALSKQMGAEAAARPSIYRMKHVRHYMTKGKGKEHSDLYNERLGNFDNIHPMLKARGQANAEAIANQYMPPIVKGAGLHFPSGIKYAKELVMSISEREKIAAQGSDGLSKHAWAAPGWQSVRSGASRLRDAVMRKKAPPAPVASTEQTVAKTTTPPVTTTTQPVAHETSQVVQHAAPQAEQATGQVIQQTEHQAVPYAEQWKNWYEGMKTDPLATAWMSPTVRGAAGGSIGAYFQADEDRLQAALMGGVLGAGVGRVAPSILRNVGGRGRTWLQNRVAPPEAGQTAEASRSFWGKLNPFNKAKDTAAEATTKTRTWLDTQLQPNSEAIQLVERYGVPVGTGILGLGAGVGLGQAYERSNSRGNAITNNFYNFDPSKYLTKKMSSLDSLSKAITKTSKDNHVEARRKERAKHISKHKINQLQEALLLAQKSIPKGTHHVKLDNASAVLKDVGKKHVLATILANNMHPPGKDLTVAILDASLGIKHV